MSFACCKNVLDINFGGVGGGEGRDKKKERKEKIC
jgi:hypothetical protein